MRSELRTRAYLFGLATHVGGLPGVVFNEFIDGPGCTSGGRIQRKACLKALLLELKEQP